MECKLLQVCWSLFSCVTEPIVAEPMDKKVADPAPRGQGSEKAVPPKRPRDDAEFAALVASLIDRFPRILARLAQ